MLKVAGDVSCYTCKRMQALEALYFLQDTCMVQTFCTLIQPKFWYQIKYCLNFQFLT